MYYLNPRTTNDSGTPYLESGPPKKHRAGQAQKRGAGPNNLEKPYLNAETQRRRENGEEFPIWIYADTLRPQMLA